MKLHKEIILGIFNCNEMMPEASDKGKPMARKDAVRHRTKVASHTEKPLGFSVWLERNTPHKNIACPWVGDIV